MPKTTTYDRPAVATLHVHLENGETWEATPDDLKKFRLVDPTTAYGIFENALQDALGVRDLTETFLNPLRRLVEVALCYPDHFEEFPDDMAEDGAEIKALEERLAGPSAEAVYQAWHI